MIEGSNGIGTCTKAILEVDVFLEVDGWDIVEVEEEVCGCRDGE
jgi:hypothetical protein